MVNILSNFFRLLIVVLIVFVNNSYSQNSSADVQHVQRINYGVQVPTRLALDDSDNIYVVDNQQKCIVVFDATGSIIDTIETPFQPISIAINGSNQIYVGTKEFGKIYKVESNGTLTQFFNNCIMPASMTFSPDGNLYVVDSEEKRVIVIDNAGNITSSFGLGLLIYPSSIAYDVRNSRILIGEHGGVGGGFTPACKVWVYDLLGNNIGSFGAPGVDNGKFYRIQGITIGKCGNIYVNEPFQGYVNVYDENFTYLTRFSFFGKELGELNVPLDIAFNSQEKIIITSMNNSTVEVFEILSDTLPTANINNTVATICSGQTSDITINFSGTPPFQFVYSIDGVAQTPITTSNNQYTLTVDTAGLYEIVSLSDFNYAGTCFTGSALINISDSLPTASFTETNIQTCEGTEVSIPIQLTGTAPWTLSYKQNGIDTTITTFSNQYFINSADTGSYELVSVLDAGCTGQATGIVNVSAQALPTVALTSHDAEICQGQPTSIAFNLSGTAPWTFVYTRNGVDSVFVNTLDNNYTVPVNQAGLYEVINISDNLCSNSNIQENIDIVIHELPTASIDTTTITICQGEYYQIPVYFTGEPPFSLSYAVDEEAPVNVSNIYSNYYNIVPTQEGNYAVNMIADNYCTGIMDAGRASVTIIPAPIPTYTYTQNALDVSFNNTSLNSDIFYWDFGDGNFSTDENPIHTYLSPGIYNVVLHTSNSYCDYDSITQVINLTSVDIQDFNDENISLYPNPTTGLITLEINNIASRTVNVEIFSMNGHTIYNNQYSNNNIIEQINLSKHPNGIYTIRIIADDYVKTSRLILNK